MELTAPLAAVRDQVLAAPSVTPIGARTHWEVGGPAPVAAPVRAPAGVVQHDPADLTVTVGAGTAVADLQAALARHGQECVLDPRDPAATVGGLLACGLSGVRRLRHGPVRDVVLEVRLVTGDGRAVRGGGPTVKNVTGYDLPRLFVGSFGTLGVLVEVTLRCRPAPQRRQWARDPGRDPGRLLARLFRPAAVVAGPAGTWALLEGHGADVDAQIAATGLEPVEGAPSWPDGVHRGRISVRPGALGEVGAALGALEGCRWLAEWGVGTVHVAADRPAVLAGARAVAAGAGGWLLREAGGGDLDGWGVDAPGGAVARRVKAAFDPEGRLSPGRLPW